MLKPSRISYVSKDLKGIPNVSVEIISIFLRVYSFSNKLNPLPFGRYLIELLRLVPISFTKRLTDPRVLHFNLYFSSIDAIGVCSSAFGIL